MIELRAGELLFGFVEENGNKAGTVGGRFINATRTAGQTVIIPQGTADFCLMHISIYMMAPYVSPWHVTLLLDNSWVVSVV